MPVMAVRLWLKVNMNRDLYGSNFTTPTWSERSYMRHNIVHVVDECVYVPSWHFQMHQQ